MDEQLRLPDFFIIGAAKCGTTDLASLLDKHPGIQISKIKEPTFFSRDDMHNDVDMFIRNGAGFWQTLDWERHLDSILRGYGRLFEDIPPSVLAGEASVWYFLSHKAPDRIHRLLPHAKLIAVLREPASRLASDYWFDVQGGRTCGELDDYFFTKQATNPVRWGLYAEHLKHWLSVFPRDQLHVVLFEEYVSPRTRQAVVDGVCQFLGVGPLPNVTRIETRSNKTGVPRWVSLELALNLVRLHCKLPGSLSPDHEFRSPHGRKRRLINTIVQSVSRLNISYKRRPPAWPPELLERLRTYYRFQNAGLSDLVGRDVDTIWYGGERSAVPEPSLAKVR
jgi:Sulfotransferase domain